MSYHHIITIEDGIVCKIYAVDFKGITIHNLLEEISTQAIIEFDSYSQFKAISKQGNIDKGLMLLDKLDNLT